MSLQPLSSIQIEIFKTRVTPEYFEQQQQENPEIMARLLQSPRLFQTLTGRGILNAKQQDLATAIENYQIMQRPNQETEGIDKITKLALKTLQEQEESRLFPSCNFPLLREEILKASKSFVS